MHRPLCALLLVAACGEVRDENSANGRPLEVEYLTEAIFAPSCGQTQCHSTFKQAGGLVFDHPDSVRRSLLRVGDPLLSFDSTKYDPSPIDSIDVPNLIVWITAIDPFGKGTGRMPFDSPLPERDVELLKIWIREPSAGVAGASAAGAQCNPENYQGLACNFNDVVACGEDFNFAEVVESCANGCILTEICDQPDPADPTMCLIPRRPGARCAQ